MQANYNGGFSKIIMAEEVVKHANNCVCPFACVTDLINDEVDLVGECLTTDSEDVSFSRSKKVCGARLYRVTGIAYLCLRKYNTYLIYGASL